MACSGLVDRGRGGGRGKTAEEGRGGVAAQVWGKERKETKVEV